MLFSSAFDTRENGMAAVFVDKQYVVGREAIAHFHPRTADRHPRNRKPHRAFGRSRQKLRDKLLRDVTLENKSFMGNRSVAGSPFRLQAQLRFDEADIPGVVNGGGIASCVHVFNPADAAAAGGLLVDIQGDVFNRLCARLGSKQAGESKHAQEALQHAGQADHSGEDSCHHR